MALRHHTGPTHEQQPHGPLREPVHDLIGRRLKTHYREIEEQPLPDRFGELLDSLDRSEQDAARGREH
jgi:hypothetical protein